MKLKRVLPLVLSLLMAGGAFAGLAGCTGKDDGGDEGGGATHSHSYGNWQPDSNGTTHTGTCTSTTGTCDAPTKTENHDYGSGTTCTKCGAPKPTGEHTHTYTQHKVTCDTCDEPNPVATTFKGWDGTDNGFTDDGVSKIYVVGDSTVCDYSLTSAGLDKIFLPRYGYGTQLHEYLNYSAENIVNLAISGRSAVSLMGETNYQTLVNSIGANDYLIIGFGHNDEKLEPNRFGDPLGNTTEPVTDRGDSWKYILNENYIKLAKHRGATPILCTPIVRYDDKGEYTGNNVHDTSFGDYPAALKELGTETGTTVVDLTTLTKNLWTSSGADAKYFHSHSSYAGDKKAANTYDGTETLEGIDKTHINMYGAKAVAYELANALKSTTLSSIVKSDIVKPTKAADYVGSIWQAYVKPDYSPFDPAANASRLVNGEWYKAVMGVSVGNSPAENFTQSYASDKYTLACNNKNTGKIQGGSDGIGTIFMQLKASDDFTVSAHVKVTAFNASTSHKQGGFGFMLRDDIHLDVLNAALNSDYVTAGILTNEGTAADTAAFSRIGGTQNKGTALSADAALDSEYDLTMTKTGTTVTVTVGTVSKTFENVNLGNIDADNIYLCMFTCREISVEFTNVNFTKN